MLEVSNVFFKEVALRLLLPKLQRRQAVSRHAREGKSRLSIAIISLHLLGGCGGIFALDSARTNDRHVADKHVTPLSEDNDDDPLARHICDLG